MILGLLFIFVGCSPKVEPVPVPDPIPFPYPEPIPAFAVGLKVTQLPDKVVFTEGEEIDFSGLKIAIIYSDDSEEEWTDYTLDYETSIGTQTVTVQYMYLKTTFEIEIKEVERKELHSYKGYVNLKLDKINVNNYNQVITDVLYGKTRSANTLIVYDNDKFVSTNKYGYEVAVNAYGKVVEIGTNVTLPNGGMVLSAHGTRIDELKTIALGDYVLYQGGLYIYKDANKRRDLFSLFDDTLNVLDDINNVDIYNKYVDILNPLIDRIEEIRGLSIGTIIDESLFNDLYSLYTELTENSLTDHTHTYSVCDGNNLETLASLAGSHYLLNYTYTGTLYYGVFRSENYLVYYNQDEYYRKRNSTGYEIGVNSENIVITKGTLVEIPEGGYVLSGHTDTADMLQDYISIGDKVDITSSGVNFYRDYIASDANTMVSEYNELLSIIDTQYEADIPHDYQYINELAEAIKQDYTLLESADNFYQCIYNRRILKELQTDVYLLAGQTLSNETETEHGMWYYPFSGKIRDRSIIRIDETMATLSAMGINDILITPFCGEDSVFKNSLYKEYNTSANDYGEYEDFLSCFIGEAHKYNIRVTAFTQTFLQYDLKVEKASYLDVDFQGNVNSHYDINNKEFTDKLKIYYGELLAYDWDGIEYDIIRYQYSTLWKYLDTDSVLTDSEIKDTGYTEVAMADFMAQYQLTGDLHELIKTSKEVRNNWTSYKLNSLNNFVSSVSAMIKAKNPHIIISAAVMCGFERAKKYYLQDYGYWLSLGYLDVVEPMAYTPDMTEFEADLKDYQENNPNNYTIRMGISTTSYGGNIVTDVAQMYLADNYQGYIIFSSSLYLNNHNFVLALTHSHHTPDLYTNLSDMITGYYQIKYIDIDFNNILISLETKDNIQIKEAINSLKNDSIKNYLLSLI